MLRGWLIQWMSPQTSYLYTQVCVVTHNQYGLYKIRFSPPVMKDHLFWKTTQFSGYFSSFVQVSLYSPGLDIKHLVYMPIGQVVLKIYVPCKFFYVPSQYLYKPCKAYVYCWKNKYMPWLKNCLPSRICNHKSLCALEQDLHAPGTRAHLNVEPCSQVPL